ncbi:RCC1 domain-containing protein 1-like [Centruroides vittatus]|uniref:RCC1 domain-containing protein 1-like n=1 Tax=Centruroides vittatus TaxID=120091 RepID=UPI0035103B7A
MLGFLYFGFDAFNHLGKKKSDVFNTVQFRNKEHVVKKIFTGWSSIFYLTEDGSLIHFGLSSEKTDPVLCSLEHEVKNVVCQWKSTFLISVDGKLMCWDEDDYSSPPNVLNEQTESVFVTEVAVGDMHSLALTNDGTLFSICKNKIEKLPFNLVVNSVCCGKEHVLCLTADGKIYSYGLGSRGQLGHGTTENEESPRVVEALEGIPIKMIATGGWHSVALSTIGDIYVWGWNESGQLGLPASISNKKLSEVVTFQAIPQLLDFPHDAIIKTVSCGSRHTAAISEDGQLWTWGWNGHDQLGLNKSTPVDYPNCVQILPEYKVQNVICNYWNTIVVV